MSGRLPIFTVNFERLYDTPGRRARHVERRDSRVLGPPDIGTKRTCENATRIRYSGTQHHTSLYTSFYTSFD